MSYDIEKGLNGSGEQNNEGGKYSSYQRRDSPGRRGGGYNDHRRRRSHERRRSYSRGRSGRDYRRSRSRDRRRDARRPSRERSNGGQEKPEEEEGLLLNKDISPSHARSRAAERRRRKLQAECIRRAGGFQKLADQEGHQTVRLFWDGFQWVAKTGQAAMLGADPALMNSTRKLRRLYFGNLPVHLGLTENGFQNIVWNEMRNRNFCNDPNVCPVLYVWFAKDKGNYGFVEFATVEETERALTMDGMNCMGVQLRVSRPNDYSMSFMKSAMQQQQQQQQQAMMLPTVATGIVLDAFKGCFLRVIQIVLPESIEMEVEYLDVLDDVKEGFEKHGKIKSAAIVAPRHKAICGKFTVGDVLIEFVDNESLLACVQNMSTRKYENRPIKMEPLDEDSYNTIARSIIEDLATLEA